MMKRNDLNGDAETKFHH